MNYNVNELEYIFRFFNPEHFIEEDIYDFFSELSYYNPNFKYGYEVGASKCVLIPDNKDYVIKIPFDGSMIEDEADFKEHFVLFYDGGGIEGWDYCELENEKWEDEIENSNYKNFFLKNIKLDICPWPIYIQQKVITYLDNNEKRYFSDISIKQAKEINATKVKDRLPIDWKATCLENLDNNEKEFINFLKFLKFSFSDLHKGNIGYLNNHAVILDYGGFNE